MAHGGCTSSCQRETATMMGRVRESGDCVGYAGCDKLRRMMVEVWWWAWWMCANGVKVATSLEQYSMESPESHKDKNEVERVWYSTMGCWSNGIRHSVSGGVLLPHDQMPKLLHKPAFYKHPCLMITQYSKICQK